MPPPGIDGPAHRFTPAAVQVGDGPVHNFPPAAVQSALDLHLSRTTWRRIGAGCAALVLVVIAFLVLRPDPPSPASTVEDYFGHLAAGDTAAALALADSGGWFTPEDAPLLVPAALVTAANRPADITVKSTQDLSGDGRYSLVTASYRLGGQTIEQGFAVIGTGDEEIPYRLEQPFLYLAVQLPEGMDLTVNGVAVGSSAARGMPALPAVYTATTSGNTLFAGATRTASYQAGQQGVSAEIDLAQLAIAPGAAGAVQTAAEAYLTATCVDPQGSASYRCPMQAPSLAWSQTTTWAVTAFPQLAVVPADTGRAQVRFTTGTAGSAAYTTTYTEFGGGEKTESGTVPIDINGHAAVGDDGAITITLGY
ncbi:hypothetical protein [Actinoplanes derwentensis]|uniref:Uncharacterized protein n=1 Tax=Actinoplanes derwentensis TaxID=113562 RepID=A0A1H2D678_9ACTN|nr:hypothetical protein [Actinoplanes derwentensis]SDT78243.1 hypothetical protein SAMN04489716_8291 [Actinoplanes derwentensis]